MVHGEWTMYSCHGSLSFSSTANMQFMWSFFLGGRIETNKCDCGFSYHDDGILATDPKVVVWTCKTKTSLNLMRRMLLHAQRKFIFIFLGFLCNQIENSKWWWWTVVDGIDDMRCVSLARWKCNYFFKWFWMRRWRNNKIGHKFEQIKLEMRQKERETDSM